MFVDPDGAAIYGSPDGSLLEVYDGGHALKMWGMYAGGENMWGSVYQTFSAEELGGAGEMLDISAMMMSHAHDWIGQGTNSATVFASYWEGPYGYTYMGADHSNPFDATFAASEWHEIGVMATIPEGATYVNIGIEIFQPNNDQHGSIYFDSFAAAPYNLALNDMSTFKVVASMNEGIFHSEEMSGYSVDNIAPAVPTGMQAMAMENSIILSWDMSEAEDFQYFVLERSNESTAGVEQSTVTYELIDISFVDVDLVRNVEYSYKLAAYDYAGNRSAFTDPVSDILLSVDQKSIFPEVYTLHQNYPNPFNPTTKICYDLPENIYVSINIYDLIGHKIRTLVNTNQDPGYRSIHWDATNDLGQSVSAGMYIYTIQAGQFRKTRKMVLLK
jgi:hypothetical protein